MSMWNYWGETPANKSNLRLLVPGKGWIAFNDRQDEEGKTAERGGKEQIESALINALSAANFAVLISFDRLSKELEDIGVISAG